MSALVEPPECSVGSDFSFGCWVAAPSVLWVAVPSQAVFVYVPVLAPTLCHWRGEQCGTAGDGRIITVVS